MPFVGSMDVKRRGVHLNKQGNVPKKTMKEVQC